MSSETVSKDNTRPPVTPPTPLPSLSPTTDVAAHPPTPPRPASSGRPPPRDRSVTPSRAPSKIILRESTLDAFMEWWDLASPKRIVVLTGAGVSTAAGIPDFRTPGTGLYDNLSRYNLPYAEAIFDIDYFREHPEPFYALTRELFPGKYKPTLSHYFIRMLSEKGLLLRLFTQNIDTLERVAGLDESSIVEAHGSFHGASCVVCKHAHTTDYVRHHILQEEIPRCTECKQGNVKPDIVFFGEPLPERFYTRATQDLKHADALIVMGTSLKVQPFASLIDRVLPNIPRLLINRERVGVTDGAKTRGFDFQGKHQKYKRDAVWLGSCDEGVRELARRMGWEDELMELYNKDHARLDTEWGLTKEETAAVEGETALADMLERVQLAATIASSMHLQDESNREEGASPTSNISNEHPA